MKKAAWILAVLMMFALCAHAETEISVNGEGTVLVSADTAVITLGVSARDRDVRKGQENVNSAIAAVREALIKEGVPAEDINTDRIWIYAEYEYSDSFLAQQTSVWYNVSSSLAIRTKDMDGIGRFIDAAFEAGANNLTDISFSAEDTSAAQEEALTAAVAAARRKAQVLADAAQLEITGIRTIAESYTSSWDSGLNNFSRDEKAMGAAETVVQAAKLSVRANISVVFLADAKE